MRWISRGTTGQVTEMDNDRVIEACQPCDRTQTTGHGPAGCPLSDCIGDVLPF